MDGTPFNNFKGVMLCNRPNQDLVVQREKPFCSRVTPYDKIGLGHKYDEPQKKPISINPVLERHKKWLEEFKLQNQLKKHAKDEASIREEEKFKKVRELAKKDREVTKQMKEEYQKMNEIIQKELSETQPQQQTVKLTEQNLRKLEEKQDQNSQPQKLEPAIKTKENKDKKKRFKSKPVGFMSKEEEERLHKDEEEELLAFVENLDYDQFINDLEVNVMIKALKQRVNELKQDDNKMKEMHSDMQKEEDKQYVDPKVEFYDKVSQSASKNNEDGKSVASERSLNSIKELKKKKEDQMQGKQDWDKTTISDQRAPLEDRIAKHVADEILRNYKNLSNVHSNNSIRKILEREAKKTLQETGLAGPVISTIKNEKSGKVDPNNLPYLHRNPAI